jgi:NADH:ubiquinone oxidoreductase subunit F (NADH-binding)
MDIEQVRASAKTELHHIRIHVGASSSNPIADSVFKQFQSVVEQSGLQTNIVRTGSFGYPDLEPIATSIKPGLAHISERAQYIYTNVTPERVAGIVYKSDAKSIEELPGFSRQKRIVLRNCGWIEPEDVFAYMAQGQGFSALANVMEMDLSRTGNDDKLLLCDAIGSNPKSSASRLLIESNPYSVLEGIVINAYNIGVSHGYILVEEKTEAAQKLRSAIDQMKWYALLGLYVMGSQFNLEIEIIELPAQCTLGYRTELFRCIEEKLPAPHMFPAIPNAFELFKKPVLIVNPEMMARLSTARDGDNSKVVTLSGSINNKCTVEAPAGTTIRSAIEEFGGGVSNGKAIKAVQLGGPSGAFVSSDDLDAAIDSDSIEVFDADSNIVDATKDIMAFIQSQSCGKCVFCREGCLQMLTILEDMSENKGKPKDLDLLLELGEEMRTVCLCAFGRSAPDPVLSSIQLFRSEYEKKV